MKLTLILSLVTTLFILINLTSSFAQMDTVITNNGNLLIGEIKSMNRGVLIMETDYSDSDFKIEWDNVREVYTDRNYLFLLSTGERFDGSFRSDANDSTKIIINSDGYEFETTVIDIVYVKSIKKDFLSRFDLSISAGYSLTKANNLHQLSIRSNFGYLAESFNAFAAFDAIRNIQDGAENTRRTEASGGVKLFLKKKWYTMLSTNLLQNDEQKIKLRATTQAGLGNFIVQTNRMYFTAAGGLAWNYETYTETTDDDKNSLEAFAGLEVNIFDIGDLSLLSNLAAYPSLTESQRIRLDYKFDLKYDFPLDFFVSIGFTLNYDNQPVEGASSSDYVLQTTFGWEL